MKLTLAFILVFCAFTVQAEKDEELRDERIYTRFYVGRGIQNVVDGIVLSAEGFLSVILKVVADTIADGQLSVNAIALRIEDLRTKYLESIENFFADIVKENESVRVCVIPYRGEVEDIKASKREEMTECWDNSMEKLNGLKKHTKKHTDAVREITKNSQSLIHNCYEKETNTMKAVECVLEKTTELRNEVNAAVSDAYQTLQIANNASLEIGEKMTNCTENVYKALMEEVRVRVYTKVLRDCVKS